MALLTITSKTFDNWNFSETSPKLRAIPSREFLAVNNSGGEVLVGGNEYYSEWAITLGTRVDGTGKVISTFTIPTIEIYSTTDAIGFTGAYYRFTIHDSFGNLLAVWDGFDRVALPAFAGNMAEWDDVYVFNHPQAPILIDRETLTRDQIVSLISESGGGAVSSVFGRTGVVVAQANDYTWAQINKTTSSLADITTRSHTLLSDIGSNTHAQIDNHIASLLNPHSVTKEQVGLGNVDNTSDLSKPISTATQTALDAKQPLDSDLTAIAGIVPVNDDIIQRKAGAWVNRTPAQFKTDLALTKSDVGLNNVQNVDTTNATNISTGTLADGRLSSNIPLKNAANTFSAQNTFSAVLNVADQISLNGQTPRTWTTGSVVESTAAALFLGDLADLHVVSNAFFDGSWKYMITEKASSLYQFQGDFFVITAPSGTGGNALTWTQRFSVSNLGNVVAGALAALATNATDGFLYIPSAAGTPTGTPTSYTGKVPLVFDTTNNLLYAYDGSWLTVGGGGGGDMTLAGVQTVTGAKTFNPTTLIIGEQSAPPTVVANSFWVDSDDGRLYFGKRDASAWLEVFLAGLSGPMSVPNGGTGVATLTGIAKGNGTSAFSAATAGTDYVVPTATVNAQTGTTYTLQTSDNGKVVTFNNAAAITVTVPSGLGAGFNVMLVQLGAGQVTLSPSSTTIRNRQSHTKLAGQYAAASLVAFIANDLVFSGDTSA